MKTNILFLALIGLIISARAQNINKQTVYTLLENEEVLLTDEYRLSLFTDDNDIYMFTKQGEQFYFIHNDKRSGPYESIEPHYLHYDVKGFFGTEVTKGGQKYYLINDVEHGPYEGYTQMWYNPEANGGTYIIDYQVEGKQHYNINGEVFGPFDQINNSVSYSSDYIDFGYEKDDQEYHYYNGETFGPFKSITNVQIKKGGVVNFTYSTDENQFARVGDKVFGPYYDAFNRGNSRDDYPEFRYKETKGGPYFCYIDGETYGPFAQIRSYGKNGDHTYIVYKENGKSYARINDETYGPYETKYLNAFIDKNTGEFQLTYINDAKENFIVHRKKTYGPFKKVLVNKRKEPNDLQIGKKLPNAVIQDGEDYYVWLNDEKYGPFPVKPRIKIFKEGVEPIIYFKNTNDPPMVEAYQGKVSLGSYLNFTTRGGNGERAYLVLKDSNKKSTIHTSDGAYGPYNKISYIKYDDGFTFAYTVGTEHFFFNKGDVTGPYISLPRMQDGMIYHSERIDGKLRNVIRGKQMSTIYSRFLFDSKNNWVAYNYTHNNKPGLVLNGNELPDETYFHLFYDNRDDSFKWFTLEDRSIVLKTAKF